MAAARRKRLNKVVDFTMCIIEFSIHNNNANNNLANAILCMGAVRAVRRANVIRARKPSANNKIRESHRRRHVYCNIRDIYFSRCRIWCGENEIQRQKNARALVTTAHMRWIRYTRRK